MKDLISIVVPVYKVEKYVSGCIDSLINQTYKNLEIILVDDGGIDNCPKILDEYASKDSRIKVIHKKNGGVSSARNEGINIATGKYIGFVDGDDTVNLQMYETLYSIITRYDADIAFCKSLKSYLNDNDELEIPKVDLTQREEKIISTSEALKMMIMDGSVGNFVCTKLFKRELFNDIRFPEGKVYEDAGTTYKIIPKANKIVYTDQELYNYFYGRVGAITSSFSEKKVLDSLDSYSAQYNFIIENFKDIKEYANVIWIRMYTSACEKICINNFEELWNCDAVLNRYESFKKAMDETDSKLLNKYLEPYRLMSCILLRYDRETYKNLSKLITDKIKNLNVEERK